MTLYSNGGLYTDNSFQCAHCKQSFDGEAKVVHTKNGNYHSSCFVCVQCFRPFQKNVYYEYDERKYCEYDFFKLYAPSCTKCSKFRALHGSWHSECFTCFECNCFLENTSFAKLNREIYCQECNRKNKDKNALSMTCFKCYAPIPENQKLKVQSEYYHAYHFNCSFCASELSSDAREKGGDLFCIRCFDKIGMPICGACRRPIEERVIHALGKTWHVEHFMCARCEKPFLGTRHYEKKGLAYCELHYQELFGYSCFVCSQTIASDMVTALSKNWCLEHFTCSMCNGVMEPNKKLHEIDLKPVCDACFESLPNDFRKLIVKLHKEAQ